jgi:hypothetical protein
MPLPRLTLPPPQAFDTRLAAAHSLRAFFTRSAFSPSNPPPALPPLLALYDALNDDDDEVRDTAAAAAAPLLGRAYEPIETADRLLDAVVASHDSLPADAVLSLAETAAARLQSLAPAPVAVTVARVLAAEDALFVVEEQNLFFDEVREARRWAVVLTSALSLLPEPSPAAAAPTPAERAVVAWSLAGIHDICTTATATYATADPSAPVAADDGPLGWSTRPDIFAACAAVVVAAAALVRVGRAVDELLPAVHELRAVAKRARLSGLLLELADVGDDLAVAVVPE